MSKKIQVDDEVFEWPEDGPYRIGSALEVRNLGSLVYLQDTDSGDTFPLYIAELKSLGALLLALSE